MSDQPFPNAPDMSREFDAVHDGPPQEPDRSDEHEPEEPSEYRIERHLTPGGEIEQVVHTEIDNRAREAIIAAQDRFRDGIGEDGQPLDIEQVPGAAEEYERHQGPAEHDRDDFEERMLDRFRQAHEHDMDHDR